MNLKRVAAVFAVLFCLSASAYAQALAPPAPIEITVNAAGEMTAKLNAEGAAVDPIDFGLFDAASKDVDLTAWVAATLQARGLSAGPIEASAIVEALRAYLKNEAAMTVTVAADGTLKLTYKKAGVAQPEVSFGKFNPRVSDAVLTAWLTNIIGVRKLDLGPITPADIVAAIRKFFRDQEAAAVQARVEAARAAKVLVLTNGGMEVNAAKLAVQMQEQAEANAAALAELSEGIRLQIGGVRTEIQGVRTRLGALETSAKAQAGQLDALKTSVTGQSGTIDALRGEVDALPARLPAPTSTTTTYLVQPAPQPAPTKVYDYSRRCWVYPR